MDGDRVRPGQGIRRTSLSTACLCGRAEEFDFTTSLDREDDRFDYGEVRFVSIGFIGDRLYFLAYADGSTVDAIRAISLRRAEKHEVRFYYASQV